LVRGAAVRYHQLVVTRKYPLDPLRRVREETVDRKARALSDSLRQVEVAEGERERTERQQRDVEREVARTAAEEGQRLKSGESTAADLARAAAWGIAKEMEQREKARLAEEARARRDTAEAHAASRRTDLADARASAELVTKHHERWQRAETAASHGRDEEDAEQGHLARLTSRGAR
jgi:hypothetical protein